MTLPLRLLLFMATLSTLAVASERPSWVDRFPLEDSSDKYYIGRATSVPSDSDAVFQATTEARKQAIGENFGVYVNFQSQSYRSMDALSATQSAQELSGQVRLEGFTQRDIYFEKTDGKVNAWLKFSYPKIEILKEKVRLEKLRAKSGDDVFKITDYGSVVATKDMGMLEIHSHPEGLKVTIDTHSDSLGKDLVTPLRIGLDIGHHIVVIDDPRYRLHQEEISVFPGTNAVVDAVMERAYGTIQVKTNIDQATVSIGTITTKSPTEKIKILAGVPILIQINHPEAKAPTQEEITVARNEDEIKNYTLDLKPALVGISTSRDGAEVEIDGRSVGQTPTTLSVSSRTTHELTITKSGYATITESLDPIPGGGTKILPTFVLYEKVEEPKREVASVPSNNTSVTDDEPEQNEADNKSHLLGIEFIYQANGSYSAFSNLTSGYINFFHEFEIGKNLGLNTGLFYGGGTETYSDSKLTSSDLGIRASLPIYFLNIKSVSFFAEPQAIYVHHRFDVTYNNGSPSASTTSGQTAYGGGVGARIGAGGSAALTLQIDLDKFSTSSGVTGNSTPAFHIGAVWGF